MSYCRGCGTLYEESDWSKHRACRASNAASNRSASNNGYRAKREESLRGPAQAVAKMGSGRAEAVQRGLQRDGRESGDVSAPTRRAVEKGVLENDGVERGLDGGIGLKQRWSRAVYNAYMRGYMKKRRAESHG